MTEFGEMVASRPIGVGIGVPTDDAGWADTGALGLISRCGPLEPALILYVLGTSVLRILYYL